MRSIRFLPPLASLLPFLLLAAPTPAAPAQQGGRLSAPPLFQEIPGQREFSGRMIARPVQPETWAARGLDPVAAAARVEAARRAMAAFSVQEYVPATDEYVFWLPPGADENSVAADLLASGNFAYVEPDWILYPIGCPNDSRFGSQWHHQANRMDSCAGWALHTGNPSVSVGICDTGVLTTHEDLQLHRLEGYNAVDRKWESQGGAIGPVHPHGTNTTGCAAANGDNGIGVAGVGWNLSHRMLRVSNSSGGGAYLSDLTHAARTAVESGDRVASVSYSGADSSSTLTTATYVKSIGGLLVWAAGNDGRNLTFGDRDADDLIVVGATDENDGSAWFSAYGRFVDLTAPGTNILTTDAAGNSSYAAVSGTSFSTPLTAGLIALIWSADPNLTPDQVEQILKQNCDDLGAAGLDDTFGYGRINVAKALAAATGGGGGGTPPTADFVGAPTSGAAPLVVDFRDLSTGSPTSWNWDFGDGNTATAQNPSHTYTQAGTYTVSLTVSNAYGQDTRIRNQYISVSGGGGGATGEGFILSKNPDFSTDDRVFTTADTLYMLVWSDQVDFNNLRKAEWELRDNAKNKVKQPLTSNGDGTYTASFDLANLPANGTAWTWRAKIEDNGRTRYQPSAGITVNVGGGSPPTADFSGTPTAGTAPLTVAFTDLSTGSPTSWNWDFGDGNTA
ncbi:MAG: PKD domain-containing protein, partial [Planctomycetota bacterium]